MSIPIAVAFLLFAAGMQQAPADALHLAGGRNLRQGRSRSSPNIQDGWYSKYHNYPEIVERIRSLEDFYANREYPALEVSSMDRQTAEGRDIWVASIPIPGYGSAPRGTYVSERFLESFESNVELSLLLDNLELVIVPVLNPDGLQYTFDARSSSTACPFRDGQSLSCDRMWRKNRQRLAGSKCIGVDMNRVWPVDWGARGGQAVSSNPCAEDYHGEHPFHAPEALAFCELMADLHGTSREQLCLNASDARAADTWVSNHGLLDEGVLGVLDIHSYGQLILGSWAHLNHPSSNNLMLDKIGTMMQRAGDEGCMDNSCMWTYGIGDVQGEIYLTSGSLTDWTHWAFGAASYTVEVPPRTRELGGFAPSETRAAAIAADAFAPVKAFIGAMNMNWDNASQGRADAGGGAARDPDCGDGGQAFKLEIANTLDYYPRELSWEVVGPSGERVAGWNARDGGTRAEDSPVGGVMKLCLGVYFVIVRDTQGDGICCEHGFGKTSIFASDRLLFLGHGDYGGARVVLVGLDYVPLVREVDPVLFPESEELATLVRSLYTAMSAKSASHWLLEQHSTAKGQPMHLIAAIVAGSIVLLLCVGVAVFVMQKRRYRNRLIPLQELPAS